MQHLYFCPFAVQVCIGLNPYTFCRFEFSVFLAIVLWEAAKDRQAIWPPARHGVLAPARQAKLWAIEWVMDKCGEKYSFKIPQKEICKAVTKVGGAHPGQEAVSQLEG